MTTLRRGDEGHNVIVLQKQLQQLGFYSHGIDGIYGTQTAVAVQEFQEEHELTMDGIVGPNTQQRIREEVSVVESESVEDLAITDEDLEEAAGMLGCETAAIDAISQVESGGSGFFQPDHPAILFERQWMYRRLQTRGLDLLVEILCEAEPELVNPTRGGYEGGMAEYDKFNMVMQINPAAAIESCSWGRFQIMGFHWERLGYESPEEYHSCMLQSEAEHLFALVEFIRTDEQLHNALINKDWTTFARIYNGPQYDQHDPPYDTRMQNAYEQSQL